MEKTPKTCRECMHSMTCRSYYGGSTCKHKTEINRKTIDRFYKKEEGTKK